MSATGAIAYLSILGGAFVTAVVMMFALRAIKLI
ncbi:cytochrome b6-f complex subunit PetL [[Phormidium] sp. ETS-05]|nr:cytochrome b6-f complex subunit PetL [[Phormidium] sp. ETS-05]